MFSASWAVALSVVAGELGPSCFPPGPGPGPRGHLHDEASFPAMAVKFRSRRRRLANGASPGGGFRLSVLVASEPGKRCSAALVTFGEK